MQNLQVISYSLLMLLVALLVYFISQNFMYLPVNDGLDVMYFIRAYYEGDLEFYTWFEVHRNSHWHSVAYWILTPLAIATGWNTYYGIAVSVLVVFVACYFVYAMFSQTCKDLKHESYAVLGWPLGAFWLLSVDQGGNWQLEWQLSLYLNLMSAIGAIYVLTRPYLDWRHIAAAMVAMLVAIYDYTTGLLLMPIGFGLILLHPDAVLKRRIVWLSVWSAVSAGVLWHFIIDFSFALERAERASSWMERIFHSIVYLGGPLTRNLEDGVVLGLLGILCLCILFFFLCKQLGFRRSFYACLPYLALAAYAIGAGMMTSFDRARFSVGLGMAVRYISFANILWMVNGILFVFVVLQWYQGNVSKPEDKKNRFEKGLVFGQVLATVLIVLYLKFTNIAFVWSFSESMRQENIVFSELLKGESIDDISDDKMLSGSGASPSVAREFYKDIKKYKLNIFSE